MKFEQLKELVIKSRCTRRFQKDVLVSNETLEEVINIARVTSSAKNMQPIKYITVTKKQTVDALSANVTWAAHLKQWSQSQDERPSAYIILLNDKNIDGFAMFDAGVTFESIMLGLNAKGLNACALASIDKVQCKELFSIPENTEIMIGIAIGKASETTKLVDVVNNDTNYYRNDKDEHCVPKRALDEVLIGKF